jgi:hypothetical protein
MPVEHAKAISVSPEFIGSDHANLSFQHILNRL